ncbi:carboxymuconolactone decarboxylase family protein [Elioraea sp.]|uniref:carboxymuconolactone decarboxylase family protein n=1 Tax=Elioraea sp. TaxID=2185103 RepID=UPI003F72C316
MESDDRMLAARLQAVKDKRGYLLAHHGLLAAISEEMLARYDALYTALALDRKVLDERAREFVWLCVLIATDEAIASHHIAKFRQGGGTAEEIAAAIRLTAWAVGARAYAFIADHWAQHLPDVVIAERYRTDLTINAGAVPPRIAIPAVAAVHAARGDHALLARAITFAYAIDVPEPELAEALTIMMFPGSVPRFVEAAKVWLDLIRAGTVRPSSAFAAWARLQGQGGFDEAVAGREEAGRQ